MELSNRRFKAMTNKSDIQHLPSLNPITVGTSMLRSGVITRGRQAASNLLHRSLPGPQNAEEQYESARLLYIAAGDIFEEIVNAEGANALEKLQQAHLRQTYELVVEWLGKASVHGHTDAQLLLGSFRLFRKDLSFFLDEAEIAKWLLKAAEEGYVGPQVSIARLYRDGRGVERDDEQAVHWFTKAAERGDAVAELELGELYVYGESVAQDYETAAVWIRKSADQGNALAQFQLALFYLNGNGVIKDIAEALTWARNAATSGSTTAQDFLSDSAEQFNLALSYLRGDGVKKNAAIAVEWARKAAEQGHADAQCFLGEAYFYGDGVKKNLSEAGEWYRKAARQGNEIAQKRLFTNEGIVVLGKLHP
jgi:TPR repeat protein